MDNYIMADLNGQPGSLEGDLADPKRKRGTYQILERAIDVSLAIPKDALLAGARSAIVDMQDADGRTRARAREFLLKLQDSGVGAAIGLDKMLRLDSGQDTERGTTKVEINYTTKDAERFADDYA